MVALGGCRARKGTVRSGHFRKEANQHCNLLGGKPFCGVIKGGGSHVEGGLGQAGIGTTAAGSGGLGGSRGGEGVDGA